MTGAAWLYVVWRFVQPMPDGMAVAFPLGSLLLVIAEYHLIARWLLGASVSPELPRAVMIGAAWAFGAFVLLTALLVLRDALGGVALLVTRRAGWQILTGSGPPMAAGVLAAVLATYGVWQAIKVPAVKTVVITLPRLPAPFAGYRIVQLSDVHASRLLAHLYQPSRSSRPIWPDSGCFCAVTY